MHYYQHNIGDYRRDTIHLSLLEHGIYRQMLDLYYLNEKPIDPDTINRLIGVRSKEEKKAIESIIADFFIFTEKGLVHRRCEKEIELYERKSLIAKENGKMGGRPKKPTGFSVGYDPLTQSEPTEKVTKEPITINHKPITINQEPLTKKEKAPKKYSASEMREVPLAVAEEYIQHRKNVKAPLSKIAWEQIVKEAATAGWSVEDAVKEGISRGWRSFKAEWVTKKGIGGSSYQGSVFGDYIDGECHESTGF